MRATKFQKAAPQRFNRAREVSRMKALLEWYAFPRIHMTVIVALTAAAGFLASYTLLRAGIDSMGARYPLALLIAYLFFLLLLGVWMRHGLDGDFGVPDSIPSGGGGSSCSSSDLFDLDGFDADLGDAMIPVAMLLLVLALALSSVWVIYTAPVLFAEIMVDGFIAARLYKRLDGIESRHWLRSAVKRTFWPLLGTALVVTGAGVTMDVHVPEATSIGAVIAALTAS